MKRFFKLKIFIALTLISSYAFSDTLYRCPNINEFSYDQDGTPHAKTNINGVSVDWMGYHYGGSPYAKATALKIAVLNDGGYGHPYQIRCTYNDEDNAVIHMHVVNQAYEATKISGANWTGDQTLWMCNNTDTNSCQFFITQS